MARTYESLSFNNLNFLVCYHKQKIQNDPIMKNLQTLNLGTSRVIRPFTFVQFTICLIYHLTFNEQVIAGAEEFGLVENEKIFNKLHVFMFHQLIFFNLYKNTNSTYIALFKFPKIETESTYLKLLPLH